MTILTLFSHAKINIGLKITGQQPDGYHTIQTVFQEISLADTITLEPIYAGWQFTCDIESVPSGETNLCVKAYIKLKELYPDLGGVRILLKKRIPMGAGLGGGSSNAATILKEVNDLYDIGLSRDELERIGASLGADVPFFIRGGTQYAEGIGDTLSPFQLPPVGSILLVTPDIHISTAWAYKEAKNRLTQVSGESKFAAAHESVDSGEFAQAKKSTFDWTEADKLLSWDTLSKLFENDFEALVFQTYPEIGEIKHRLLDAGAVFASLSGSGSTVFGIFNDEAQAQEAQVSFMSKPVPNRLMEQADSLRTFIVYPIIH